MAFVLVVAGILMIVTGARGTYGQFGQQLQKDFTGAGNFIYWIVSLGLFGAIGYVDALRTLSRLLMALVLIGMVLSNRGVFAQFAAALKSGPTAPNAPATAGSATAAQPGQNTVAGSPITLQTLQTLASFAGA